MDVVENNQTHPVKLDFSDGVSRVICITMPHISPFLEGTVIHKHAMEYYNPAAHTVVQSSGDMIVKDQRYPPLRLDFMSNVFPFVLPLCKNGTLITPTHDLGSEVHRFVDFMAGSNLMWCDFATYLSKPPFQYGIPFIPQPMVRVDHAACLKIVKHRFFGEAKHNRNFWIDNALGRCGYQFVRFTDLPDDQFEFEACSFRTGHQTCIKSSEIQTLFLNQPLICLYESIRLSDEKSYYYQLSSSSPHIGTMEHFEFILLMEWLHPITRSVNYKNQTELQEADDLKLIQLFKHLRLHVNPNAK
jgi:hypothetical protein